MVTTEQPDLLALGVNKPPLILLVAQGVLELARRSAARGVAVAMGRGCVACRQRGQSYLDQVMELIEGCR
jgi:hypothetical protein